MNEAYESQNRRRNTRRFWRAVTASFATALIVSLSVVIVVNEGDRHRLVAENERLTTKNSQIEESIEKLTLDTVKYAVENTALSLRVAEQDSVLDARVGFLEAVTEARALLEESAGLVDTRSFRELVHAQQEVVGEERKYAVNVDSATATVRGATTEVRALLDARLQELGSTRVAPGIDVEDKTPFDMARRALDDVGGSWVGLYTDDVVCSSGVAMACSSSHGHITVANRVMGRDYDFMYQVMMHEYAHQIQFLSLDKMFTSTRYIALFGGYGDKAIEAAADCMAAARTTMTQVGYGFGCTEEQLAWGRGAWDGEW